MRRRSKVTSVSRPQARGTSIGARPVTARFARRFLHVAARSARGGRLMVDEPDGRVSLGRGALSAHVVVNDVRAYPALLRHGSVGLGIGYLEGWWDSDDLVNLVRILIRSRGRVGQWLDQVGQAISVVLNPWRRLRRREPHVDRRYVQAHYDIGNEFFELMLDETMSYSCAIFESSTVSLEEASVAKFDRLCRKLGLESDDHLLEIGTGWGGFAIYAATHYGCRVTTTTISAEQFAYATRRVAELGLGDRVTVLNEDYRDVVGTYDKIVSIEMIEAVDWRQVPGFFEQCSRLLDPHGLMALQAITIDERSYERAKNATDFIKAFIFPGGCLPAVSSITRASARSGLSVVDLEDIGRHYAETLGRWRARFDEHRAELEELGYDERFRRLWTLYLTYCEAAFLERHVSDVQIVLARSEWRPNLSVRP